MTTTFRRFAGCSAVLASGLSLVYTISFALFVHDGYRWAHWTSTIALMVTAFFATPTFVALHGGLRGQEPEFSGLALVIGSIGAIGASIHGAYDLAVLVHPVNGSTDLPSQIDPRGFLTFAVTGLALGIFGWLVLRTGRYPRVVGQSGMAAALLLLVVYFGRLIALDPNRTFIRVATLAAGLIVLPAFYLVLGNVLLQPGDRLQAGHLQESNRPASDTQSAHLLVGNRPPD